MCRASSTHAGPLPVADRGLAGTADSKDPGKLIVPALEALSGGPQLVVVTTGGCRTDELRERFAAENIVVEDFADFEIARGVARILGDRRFATNAERLRSELASYRPYELIDGYLAA